MTIQPISICLEDMPLIAPLKQEPSKVEIVADMTMAYYAAWGMEMSLLKVQSKKSFVVLAAGAATVVGSLMMSIGFSGLGYVIPAYSCLGLYMAGMGVTTLGTSSSATKIRKIKDIKAKLADLFDAAGKLKDIRDENGRNLASFSFSYWSVCQRKALCPNTEKENENSLLAWCEFLLEKGFPLNPPAWKDSLFYYALVFNCLPLAQLLIEKGAKPDLLNSSTWTACRALKNDTSDMENWYKLLPSLREKTKLCTGLKILSHAFEVDFYPKSAGEPRGFDCFGMPAKLAAQKILKIYRKMHSALAYPEDSLQIIERSLQNLIEEKYSLEEQNLCLLMDIGYNGRSKDSAGHAIYFWIYDNNFIYADTGTNTCFDLFGINQPACIGQFERDKLTPEILKQLLSIKSLTKNESMLMRKELLCNQLGLHEQNNFPFACERQEEGSCSWTGLIACLAAGSYFFRLREGKSYENAAQVFFDQRYDWAMFNRVLPLYYFDSSSWAEKHFLVSDPQFLPAWQKIGAKIRYNWTLKEILSIPESTEEVSFNLTIKFKVCTALDTIDTIVNGLKNHMKIELG